jgi:hypothetical protein
MESVRTLSSIHRAAIYEPPFLLDGLPYDLVERFKNEIVKGKLAAALVTASKIVRLTPPALNAVPRSLLEIGTGLVLRNERKNGTGEYAGLDELLPSMRYDFGVLLARAGKVMSFSSVSQPVLLLGGTKSPSYLKAALGALENIIPNNQRVELEGLDHSGPWNSDKGGHPEVVAKELVKFFTEEN